MSPQLPFTFAWVDPSQTTFDVNTMNVFDEEIISFKIDHQEGQIPTLDIVIKNPRVGLLSPGRKQHAWLGWATGLASPALVPLFFGVLVGIPTNMFKELITLQFIARSPTFIADKQAVAEAMKAAPYYDPLFLDDAHRDDPDSILEGWSAFWHIDRITNQTTASDVLVGEDGVIVFQEGDALYDGVEMQLGQPPLVNVRVEASVNWTQRSSGYMTVPTINLASYTGDSFMGEWPRPGASIGGGYRVESSYVTDVYHVAQTPTTNYQSSWTAQDNPGQCGTESQSTQSSGPALLSPNALSVILTEYTRSGVCLPDGDPPQNIPAQVSITGMIVPAWYLSCNMTLRYDASRSYTEYLSFDMVANVQSVLASPLVDQNTELLSLQSVDVGAPMFDISEWTDFANKPVGIAEIIWPNNPTKPGGLAYQICIQPGTAGAVEPDFSDGVGVTTTDGTVTWASLGTSIPTSTPRWSPGTGVPAGQVVLMQQRQFNAATGEFELVPDMTSYYMCITGGITSGDYQTFSYTPPVTSNDEPTPEVRVISDLPPPTFSQAVGTIIQDGSVQWMVLGQSPSNIVIPIGGTPTDVTANNFFPTARGQQSVEYLISRARARLRYRARAVTLNFQSTFEKLALAGISCRMSGQLYDPRLPGGNAIGKVIAYSLECENGKLRGNVSLGCAVGFGEQVVAATGVGEYAAEGYALPGWQRYDGQTILTGNNDTAYTPPAYQPFDDGLSFPLTWQNVSDGGVFSGTLAAQAKAIKGSFHVAAELAFLQNWAGAAIGTGNTNQSTSGINPNAAWQIEREELALASQSTPYVMEANPVSWTCLLKPCNGNGPFIGSYSIQVTPLSIVQGINLEATSVP